MAELSPSAEQFTAALVSQPEARAHIALADTPFFKGDWVDRFYPGPHHDDLNLNEDSAWELIHRGQEHTAILGRFGIISAESYSVPAQKRMFGEETTVIRSLVELVDGVPFEPVTRWGESTPHLDQAKRVVEGLISYLGWVLDTRPSVFIGDCGKIGQYVATPEGHAVRVDIDQTLWPSDDETVLDTLCQVQRWVKRMPDPNMQNPLRTQLGHMMLQLRTKEQIAHWL